jgi:hypothetical protein
LVIVGEAANDGDQQPGVSHPGSTQEEPYVAYRWASVCAPNPSLSPPEAECGFALTCDGPELRRWQLWGELRSGAWEPIRTQCFGGTPPEFVPPTVTPGHVLSALRRVGLPRLETHVQPAAKTLVNFETIFYTDAEPVTLDLTILRQAVEVEATPSEFTWAFGDGTSATTSTPGDPFPAKTVTHRYLDAQVTMRPHVEVTYSARFRVNGGDWQDIDGTVTTIGPPTSVRVAEATPLLSGVHR